MLPRTKTLAGALAAVLTLAGLLTLAAGCGSSRILAAQTRPSPVVHVSAGEPAHIAVVVMENKEYGDVIGNADARYLNALGGRYAMARQTYAISHPSLPNYLALTGGSTFGISSDCTYCRVHATSLVDQIEHAHLSWRAYMEDLPYPCFRGSQFKNYAIRHDPFMYYTPVRNDPARCHDVVPLSRLAADERAGSLPRFIWISPNLCHDMHDCDVATGDRFLARLVPGLLAQLGPGGLLFVTWDEGSSDDGCCRLATGGHIVTIVAGPGARPRARLRTPTDHYSLLQTIDDLFGLPRLRGARCACTPSLSGLLRR